MRCAPLLQFLTVLFFGWLLLVGSLAAYLFLLFRNLRARRRWAVIFLLAVPGNYFAFLHYDNYTPRRPANIDFFVIDLKGRRLYLINHNT